MKPITIECPNCGAAIKVTDKSDSILCEFCGSPIHLSKEPSDSVSEKDKTAEAKAFIEGYHLAQEHQARDARLKKLEDRRQAKSTGRPVSAPVPTGAQVPRGRGCLGCGPKVLAVIIILFVSAVIISVFREINEMGRSAGYSLNDAVQAVQQEEAELTTLNPFDYVRIEWYGLNGRGEARIINTADPNTDPFAATLQFDFSESAWNLSEGESLTLEVTTNDDSARKAGYVLEPKTMTVQVGRLDNYITDIAQVDDETLEQIHVQSRMSIQDKYESGKSINLMRCDVGEIHYEGTYLLSAKNPGYGTKNLLYDVFTTSLSGKDGDYVVWDVITYSDVILTNDDIISIDLGHHYYEGHTRTLSSTDGVTTCYTDATDVFNSLIFSQRGEYTATKTDGMP